MDNEKFSVVGSNIAEKATVMLLLPRLLQGGCVEIDR